MKCHVLSWSGFPGFRFSASLSPLDPSPFCPPRRTRRTLRIAAFAPPRGTRPTLRVAGPFSARIGRRRGRPLAPARFARLIARAHEAGAGRTSPLCFPEMIFSRRRETEGDAASRMPLPSARFILAWNLPGSSSFQEFLHFREQTKILGPKASSPSEAIRPPTPGRMGRPAGADCIGIGPDLCQDRPVSTFRRMRSGRVGRRECAAARRCKACPISRDAGPVRTPPETSVRSKTARRGAASGCGRRKRSCASPASAHFTRPA